MQPLASDLDNTQFVGAVNPDSLLHVEFFMHEPIDKWASEEASYDQGRKVTIKLPGGPKPFIKIMKPGDNTSIITEAVREDHKRRFAQQWLYFQMNEGMIDDGANIPGWKLDDWDEMKDKPDLLRDLKYKRFHTVEQLAGASDAQVQGMGIGGLGLREQAKSALRAKVSSTINEEIRKKDAQLAAMQDQMGKMQEQMAQLMAAKAPEPAPAPRRGRPPKEVANG